VRRAARLGDELVISVTQRKDDILRMESVYDSELRSLGKDPKQKRTTLNRIFFVVDNPGEKEEAERYFMDIFLGLYLKWGHQNITGMDEGSRTYEQIMRNHFIIGEYSQCIDTIIRYEQLGIGEICCLMNFGSPDLEKVEKSLRLNTSCPIFISQIACKNQKYRDCGNSGIRKLQYGLCASRNATTATAEPIKGAVKYILK